MYGKIFESIYDGTLAVNWKAMIVFQQLIVLCDSDGVIDMTPLAISRRTNIPIDIIEEGIKFLTLPDEYSRSKLNDGKRIIPIDEERIWGWEVVNHAYYRNLASIGDKREKDRKRIADKRKREKESQLLDVNGASQGVADSSDKSPKSPIQIQDTGSAHADTKTLSDPTGSEGGSKPPPCPHEEIIKLYLEVLPMCPDIKGWTEKRKIILRARWREEEEYQELSWWRGYFEYIKKSKFLTGLSKGNDGRGPFTPNLVWFIESSNFVKVLEGYYHRNKS